MRAMDRMRKIQIGRLYPELSPQEEHLLTIVMDRPDGITVSALSRELGQPMSAVSRMMRNLEARSLIERRIMPQDRRSIIVSITPEGRSSCEELHACLHRFFLEMLGTFDPGEFDQLMGNWTALMDRMESALERQLAEGLETRNNSQTEDTE